MLRNRTLKKGEEMQFIVCPKCGEAIMYGDSCVCGSSGDRILDTLLSIDESLKKIIGQKKDEHKTPDNPP